MNQVTTLYNFIKSLAEADDYINTVTKNATAETLQNKATVFPLLNVDITGASYPSPQTKNFTLEITCFNKRDYNNDGEIDRFYGTDNELDNLNETEAALNRIWLSMESNFQDNNITSGLNPTLTPILEGTTTLVDGWTLSLEVTTPNTTISLC